jgi:hypothetical protein
MTDFTWTENSRTVFDEGVKAAPAPFRAVTQRSLLKGLARLVGDGGEVHEADVVQAIKQNSPAPFIPMGMKAIAPYLTVAPTPGRDD